MRDRRYRTARWQKLRLWVLARDGWLCQVRGPRCEVVASSAHHIKPTSQHPELFWDVSNLQAACGPCNNHGARTRNENRANRATIAELERLVANQRLEIELLTAALAKYESDVVDDLPRIG